jgi:hypothetical protein
VAMLDADDWVYPDKLAKQVEILSTHEDVFLVSCGMAIAGLQEGLIGVRGMGLGEQKIYTTPGKIPLAHAPSLFRRSGVRQVVYDQKMKIASDSDFLRRVLIGKRYFVMHYVGYCYRELASARIGKIVAGYYYNSRGLAKFLKVRPLSIGWQIIMETAKILVYLAFCPLGLFRVLIKRRSRIPSEAERVEFHRAKTAVQTVHDRILSAKAS